MTLGTPCSLQSAAVGEPLAGTAPRAKGWVVVEQGGPWGRDVLVDSLLPEAVKESLRAVKAAGIGVLLARHPLRGDRESPAGHHVLVARSTVSGAVLREAVLDDLAPLADLDAEAVLRGEFGSPAEQPALLVCTHSRRDACCAVHGRALVSRLRDAAPERLRERIWECSHVGGHRFAPVTLSLPSGVVHGRLSVDEGAGIVSALDAGRLLPDRLRGRSVFAPPVQAAEVTVRQRTGEDRVDVIHAEALADEGDEVLVSVAHADGRTWQVRVVRHVDDVMRSESCGKDPLPLEYWSAVEFSEIPA